MIWTDVFQATIIIVGIFFVIIGVSRRFIKLLSNNLHNFTLKSLCWIKCRFCELILSETE